MHLFRLIIVGTATAWGAVAGPLQKAHIAADAQWVIHLDVEALLATRVGDTLAREALDPKLAGPTANLKQELGFDFNWRRIRSLTLYGTDFTGPQDLRGVLLVETDMDVAQGLEAARSKFAAAGQGDVGGLRRLDDVSFPLYCLQDMLYVAAERGRPVVVGKGRGTAVKARAVLQGEAPNLKAAPGFGEFCQTGDGFFFVAAAQGFSETAPVPPQAKVLRMADGLRFSLGEFADQVRASLALSTRTRESAQQIQLVVQGMLALATLSQPDDPDLQTLLRSMGVSLDDKVVTLNVSLPSGKLSQKIIEEQEKERARD